MSETHLLLILVCIALFALFSGPIGRASLTPPMAFASLGLLLSPVGLGWIEVGVDSAVIHVIAEITLILVLFTDAARINLKSLWSDHDLPVRMLLFGMPLTILLGSVFARVVFPELLLLEALVLAIILAPTDAALGQTVVSSPKVPQRIRQTLNVESGANDGIALPALLFAISLAATGHGNEHDTNWVSFVLMQLVLGPLSGILIGWVGARAINSAIEKGFLSHEFCNIYLLSVAFIAYLGADQIGGNGFISAFAAGAVVGNTLKHVNEEIYEFAESEGQMLNLIIFFIFGVALLPQVWASISMEIMVYAILSLTLVRMVPVFISLIGKHLRWETTVFLGWFGPRGLASILFVLLVLDHSDLVHKSLVFNIVIVTVALSVVLHGLTARSGVNVYAAALKTSKLRGENLTAEQREVESMQLRHSPSQKQNNHD